MNKEELKEKYGKKRVPHQWRGTDFVSAQICTFFGSGMSPKAPGTMGSLAAAIVAYPIGILAHKCVWNYGDDSVLGSIITFCGFNIFAILAIITFFASIPFVNKAMRDTKTEDPGWIVIDEVCGVWTALAIIQWLPGYWGVVDHIIKSIILLLTFGIFRFFDILKPLGIHRFEKFPGAWGVMADDLLGGIYTGIVVKLLTFIVVFIIAVSDFIIHPFHP